MRFIRTTQSCLRLSSSLAENVEQASRFSDKDKMVKAPAIRGKQSENEVVKSLTFLVTNLSVLGRRVPRNVLEAKSKIAKSHKN